MDLTRLRERTIFAGRILVQVEKETFERWNQAWYWTFLDCGI
jgi:hypothetical protein